MITRYGTMIVVSGPSGAGKSTLIKALRERLPDLAFSVSCTTRLPRPGEQDGRDYHFISREEFERRIAAGDFIEHAAVFDNYYGTLYSEAADRIKAGQDVFLDIDVQGAMQIKQRAQTDNLLGRCAEFVFVVPPTYAELERRLRGRGTETEEVIRKRLSKAMLEVSSWREYDYVIITDEVENSTPRFLSLISGFNNSTRRIVELDFQ